MGAVTDQERIDALKAELEAPERAALERLANERDEYKKLYKLLLEENAKLKRGLTGNTAEKLPNSDAQLTLSVLEMLLGNGAPDSDSSGASDDEPAQRGDAEVAGYRRSKPSGRAALDAAGLPEVVIEIIPDEVKR